MKKNLLQFESDTETAEALDAKIERWVNENWHDYDDDLAPAFLASVFAGQYGGEYYRSITHADEDKRNRLASAYHDYKLAWLKNQAKEHV